MRKYEVVEILRNAGNKGYHYDKCIVTDKYLDKKEVYLCALEDGRLLRRIPRARRRGWVYGDSHVMDWVNVEVCGKESKNADLRLFKKHIYDAIKMLNKSGLWEDIRLDLKRFVDCSDDVLSDFLSSYKNDGYATYDQFFGVGKYAKMGFSAGIYNILSSLSLKNCWKSIPFKKWDREHYTGILKNRIENKEDFRYDWQHGYDNSIEVRVGEDGKYRGWLSCEYRGCGNGHYYLLFDATHAIFSEDD